MMNKSPSKQTHLFSKADRFPQIKANYKAIAASVNMNSDFDSSKKRTQVQFCTTQQRFKYYNTSELHGKLPSPASYGTVDRTFSPEVSRQNGKSFGIGRDKIQKIGIDKDVDEIVKKMGSPAPNKYEPTKTFGKVGIQFSMRNRMHRYGYIQNAVDNHYFE